MNDGYVLAYRRAWYHPAFKDLRDAAIWNFLFQNAFWQPGQKTFNGQTFDLQRGQIVVSISYLAKGFHMSEKEIRGAIKRLAEGEMVVIQGASKGTIITICNYDKYQLSEKTEGEQKATTGRALGQSQGDNKKETNKPNERKKEYTPEFLDFWSVYPKTRAGSKDNALHAWNKALTKITVTEIMNATRLYAKSEEVSRGYAKGCAAWLNDERWTTDYTVRPNPHIGNSAPSIRKSEGQFEKGKLI